MRSGHADLSAVEITVLDEADHMADLGFLPGVKRLLDRTPRRCQRLLFSATLDGGVDVLVKRYLHDPVVHSVDSAQSPVSAMVHHVLHVDSSARVSVVADLAASPGRKIVFARTKHGAKNLARQLNSRGVAAVELHGNLSQNARTRNLAAFSDGSATVLVATDIAARGIHVDDVSLVVHADPPVEHKAYLHRSGRTARAGADGTVVTLMHDAQVSDVRQLTRKAGVKPTITRFSGATHPVLQQIAPGERASVSRRQPRAHRKLSPRIPAGRVSASARRRTLPQCCVVLGERVTLPLTRRPSPQSTPYAAPIGLQSVPRSAGNRRPSWRPTLGGGDDHRSRLDGDREREAAARSRSRVAPRGRRRSTCPASSARTTASCATRRSRPRCWTCFERRWIVTPIASASSSSAATG